MFFLTFSSLNQMLNLKHIFTKNSITLCSTKDSGSAKLDGDDYVEETPQAEATRRHAIVEKEVRLL